MKLLPILLLIACSMDQGLSNDPENSLIPAPEEQLDIVYVLDNSCSMLGDWATLTFGLAYATSELNQLDTDWQLSMISMDPADTDLWIEIYPTESSSWEVVTKISDLRSAAGGGEAGFDSLLTQQDLHSGWFRDGWLLIVFVSDEEEQSTTTTTDNLRQSQSQPLWITSVVGPNVDPENNTTQWYPAPETPCYAEKALKYHNIADSTVDICTREPFSVFTGLF